MADQSSTPPNYDLTTLEGISRAREYVFTGMMGGSITEQRAVAAEKMLRGQTQLKGELPMKFLGMISGNRKFEAYSQELAMSISGFVNGRPALPSGD